MLIKNLYQFIPYILPIIGVSFFDWSTYIIILFFCIENFIQGIFFILRGLFSVIVARKIRGLIFLILTSLLFFPHATGSLGVAEIIDGTGVNLVTISWKYLVINIFILIIPHIVELYYFGQSVIQIQKITSDKSQTKAAIKIRLEKQDMRPTLDFMLDFQEMFGRIIVLWLSFPMMFIMIFFSTFFNLDIFIINILCIIVFSVIHYMLGQYYITQRGKIFNSYQNSLQQK